MWGIGPFIGFFGNFGPGITPGPGITLEPFKRTHKIINYDKTFEKKIKNSKILYWYYSLYLIYINTHFSRFSIISYNDCWYPYNQILFLYGLLYRVKNGQNIKTNL